MATDLKLSFASGDYEITRALVDGSVKPRGIELVPDTRLGSRARHWAMAKDNAYDVCEFNAAAYIMARDRDYPWTAIPTFCHRRFRQGFIFVRPGSGIVAPRDLIGRKVGGTNFQPAGNVWVRGILADDYGVSHKDITWFTERGEDIEFEPEPGLAIHRIGKDQSLEQMLVEGEIDAIISPEFPDLFLAGDPRVERMFPDYQRVERDYYRRTGLFPIMHVTVVKREIVDRHPWVVESLMAAFEEAKQKAYHHVANPRVVPLAWWSAALEEQNRVLGPDPWEYGLSDLNRRNVETLARYVHTQGLAGRLFSADELLEG